MESMHPLAKMIILLCLLVSICSCSLLGGFFGTIFSVFGDVLNLGIENLPRLLPYLLFFVERQDVPEEEQIFLAQYASEETLTTASYAIVNAIEKYRPAMVIAIPENADIEQQRTLLLEKLKGKKVHVVRVNASDLCDQIISQESFGKRLSQFKLTVVAPKELDVLAKAAYRPQTIEMQQWQQEFAILLQRKNSSHEPTPLVVARGALIEEMIPTY